MLFNSFPFLLLLSITFIIYYLPLFSRFQVLTLIASSLFFYAFNQPVLVLLLLFSVSINIVSSYLIVYGDPKYRKTFAVLGVVLNLSILIFFKYTGLIYTAFFKGGNAVGDFIMTLPLPIGISFFTFQGISLVVDVYQEKYMPGTAIVPKSFLKHSERIMFFKGFFPQLISGPIVKAHDFFPQIGPKKLGEVDWNSVFKKLVVGYFLKMVVADNLGNFTFWMDYPHFIGASSTRLLALLFGYSCQIFADFAGYSLIAIGLAKLFGYDFPKNFDFPYISTSFRDFWKRWNISLSSFLMIYLYIPLGGNKKGKVRTYFNLMVTMLLGGLWHGAAWSYAVWGFMHGLALVVERLISGKKESSPGFFIKLLRGLMVFSYVSLAWLLFKLPNFYNVIEYVQSIFHNTRLEIDPMALYVLLYSIPVVFYHLFYLHAQKPLIIYLKKFDYVFYGLMIFLIFFNSGPSQPFIYFQF